MKLGKWQQWGCWWTQGDFRSSCMVCCLKRPWQILEQSSLLADFVHWQLVLPVTCWSVFMCSHLFIKITWIFCWLCNLFTHVLYSHTTCVICWIPLTFLINHTLNASNCWYPLLYTNAFDGPQLTSYTPNTHYKSLLFQIKIHYIVFTLHTINH